MEVLSSCIFLHFEFVLLKKVLNEEIIIGLVPKSLYSEMKYFPGLFLAYFCGIYPNILDN